MKFLILALVILLAAFNIFAFVENHQQILPFSFFFLMPLVGIFYGTIRRWEKTQIDLLIYLNSFLVYPISDSFQFLMKTNGGIAFEVLIASVSYGIYALVFLKEGVRFLKITMRDIPKIIGIFVSMVITSWLFLNKMSDFIYYLSAFYTVFVALAVNLGYLREASFKSRTIGSIGITLIYVKELFYGYYFVVEKSPNYYVAHYICHVIANLLIISAIAINLNESKNGETHENGIMA